MTEFEKALRQAGVELDELEQVSVTATRTEQKTIESDRSINVVDRRRMREMQATSVPDALAESGGVFIQKTNRSAGAPMIRGMVGPQNLLLVDGIRLNTSTYRTGPLQYLNVSDPFAFARIEVVRGPGSVLYGSDSFGGTVQMLTPEIDFSRSHSLHASAGTFTADRSFVGDVGGHAIYGPVGVSVGVGFRNFGKLIRGSNGTAPEPEVEVYESNNRHISARGKVTYKPTDRISITGNYLMTSIFGAGRIDRLTTGDWRKNDNTDHLAYLRVKYTGKRVLEEVVANVSFHRLEERVDRFTCDRAENGVALDLLGCTDADDVPIGTAATVNRYREITDAVNVFGGFVNTRLAPIKDLKITGGVELYQESISSSLFSSRESDSFGFKEGTPNYVDGSQFLRFGAYVHAHYVPWQITENWRLTANAGARFVHSASSARNVPQVGVGGTPGDVDQAFSSVIGTGGVMISDGKMLGFYANVAQGFRAPNMQELTQLGDSGAFFNVPNAELAPEKVLSLEVGAKLSTGPVRASVAFFDAELSDLIVWVPSTFEGSSTVDGKDVLQRRNAGSGRYLGVEARVSGGTKNLRAYGHGTWIHGSNEDPVSNLDVPARFVPPIFYGGGLRYSRPGKSWYARWYTEFYVRGAAAKTRLNSGDLKDLRTCGSRTEPGTLKDPCDSVAAWVTLNLRAGFLFAEHFWFDVSFNNLTDLRYRSYASGFDFPGFGVSATLTASY